MNEKQRARSAHFCKVGRGFRRALTSAEEECAELASSSAKPSVQNNGLSRSFAPPSITCAPHEATHELNFHSIL